MVNGCVSGENIRWIPDTTLGDCMIECALHGDACVGVEFFTGDFANNYCVLASASDTAGCDNDLYHVAFYPRGSSYDVYSSSGVDNDDWLDDNHAAFGTDDDHVAFYPRLVDNDVDTDSDGYYVDVTPYYDGQYRFDTSTDAPSTPGVANGLCAPA